MVMINKITKKSIKKKLIPAVSTYKLQSSEIYYQSVRTRLSI